jgi:hypothetical protein
VSAFPRQLAARSFNKNIGKESHPSVYRFWTHLFSEKDIYEELHGYFSNFQFFDDVLPEEDSWSGSNVTFCVALK